MEETMAQFLGISQEEWDSYSLGYQLELLDAKQFHDCVERCRRKIIEGK